jgi:hypothetical protein
VTTEEVYGRSGYMKTLPRATVAYKRARCGFQPVDARLQSLKMVAASD